MAWIVADSFDYYGVREDLPHSVWDSAANPNLTPGRFGGQALVGSSGPGACLVKQFGSNEATVYVTLAQYHPAILDFITPTVEHYLEFVDGATTQCCICFNINGSIQLRSGSRTGTILATYLAAFQQTVWNHFQFKVVIDPTVGEFRIRKNGQSTDTFSATGLNTRGGTTNSYANMITLNGVLGQGAGANYFDDILIFSGSGAAPNTFVGDCRGVCLRPIGDTAQKQFTPYPPTPAFTQTNGTYFSNTTTLANTVIWSPAWVPSRNATLQTVVLSSQGTGPAHSKIALYLADPLTGLPGTVVATSDEVTTPAGGGANISYNFSTLPVLSAWTTYQWALLMDGTWTVGWTGLQANVQTLSRAYGSGFPATGAGATPVYSPLAGVLWTALSGVGQYSLISDVTATGDADYVSSLTLNNEDLYTVDQLPITPAAIIGVAPKAFIRKSDAGIRNCQLRLKSGATASGGPDSTVSSTYTYLTYVATVDPNTSTTWTNAAVNAIQLGHKITL